MQSLHQTKVLWRGHHIARMQKPARRSAARRGGFTLIELMVVLAIAAIVTSITVNGFRELSDGNKRTTCQTNLHQVYQGLRLYMNDEAGGVPLYYQYTDNTLANRQRNIGLWALYTYPRDGAPDQLAPIGNATGGALNGSKPVGRYIRSAKVLHCPADFYDEKALATGQIDREELYNEPRTELNPDYLSYQVSDNGMSGLGTGADIGSLAKETYMPSRTIKRSDKDWKRQLRLLDGTTPVAGTQPQDDTIVTWCRWHQYNRGFDNVLFFDGSVQYIQHDQPNPNPAGTPATLTNWQRVPKPIVP